MPGEIQAETRSSRLRLQTIEGFKNIFMLFDRNSGSFIPDFNGPGFINQNRNRTKTSAVIDGIANDICQCLLDLQDVCFDPDLIGARLEGKVITRFNGERGKVGSHAAGEFSEIDDLALAGGPIKELVVKKLLRQMRQPLDVLDQSDTLRLLLQ